MSVYYGEKLLFSLENVWRFWHWSYISANISGNSWDDAYHRVLGLLAKVSSIRDMEEKLLVEERELEMAEARVNDFRWDNS